MLVDRALNTSEVQTSQAILEAIPVFEAQLKERLDTVVPAVREAYDKEGRSSVPNRIRDCRSYPLYGFVRSLGTQLLSGLNTVSPGQDIEKVFDAIAEGKLVAPLLECVWTGAPGPFPAQQC